MNMNKWALSFAVLLATSTAFAEAEEDRFPQSAPITLPSFGSPSTPSAESNACAGVDEAQKRCEESFSIAYKACYPTERTTLAAEIEKMKKNEKEDGSSMNGSCDSIVEYNKKLSEFTTKHAKACEQALPQCVDYCRTRVSGYNSCPNIGSLNLEGNAAGCERLLPKFQKEIADYKTALKKSASDNSCSASAATGDDDKEKKTAEKSDDKKDEKGTDWSKLLAAGMPLLSSVLGDGSTASTTGGVAADQAAAPTCMQPANFKTCECNVAYCQVQNASVATVGAALTNTGGAAMTANAEDVKLPAEQWTPGAPATNNDGGGASAAGMYAGGGGGMGGGHANFTPDAPKGRAGSSLNADILAGVKTGGGGGTASAAGSGGPRSFDTPTLKDPEKLPGYALGAGIPTGADLKNYMPPVPPAPSALRTISSDGDLRLHPASAIGWNEISRRYRADTFLDPNLP